MTLKGKVLAGSRGDYYLLCFREDQCVCKPLLHLLYFNRFENQDGLHKKQRSVTLTFCEVRRIQRVCRLFPDRTNVCSKTTQISAIDTARSPRCGSLLSPLRRPERIPVAGQKGTLNGWCPNDALDSFAFHISI